MSFASQRDSGNFSGKYKQTGFFQAGYNEIFLDSLVAHIQTHFADLIEQGVHLNILDIGAGSGNSTVSFQQKLIKAGVPANIEATDISSAQIAVAKQFENEHLQFRVESAEALQAKNKYHIVVCLFAYHWFNNKTDVAIRIKEALTEDGLFFAMIPLEKPKFFALRQESLHFWRSYLDNIKINPLIDDPEIYRTIFEEQFENLQMQYQRNAHEFSEEKFQGWLESWTPEMRGTTAKTRSNTVMQALPPQTKKRILTDFTDRIPEGKADEDVSFRKEGAEKIVQFGERIVVFACSRNTSLEFKLTAPDVEANSDNAKRIKQFK